MPITRLHRLRPALSALVNLSDLTKRERIQVDNVFDADDDPSVIFDRKVEYLAELLSCTEEQATRELLRRL